MSDLLSGILLRMLRIRSDILSNMPSEIWSLSYSDSSGPWRAGSPYNSPFSASGQRHGKRGNIWLASGHFCPNETRCVFPLLCVFCSIFRKNGKKLVELISLFVPVFDSSQINYLSLAKLTFFHIHSQNLQNNFHFQGWKHLVFFQGTREEKALCGNLMAVQNTAKYLHMKIRLSFVHDAHFH